MYVCPYYGGHVHVCALMPIYIHAYKHTHAYSRRRGLVMFSSVSVLGIIHASIGICKHVYIHIYIYTHTQIHTYTHTKQFVGAIGWACFLVSLCWLCTRPWASLLLATISLGAHVATSLASPVFVLIWALTSGFFCYWYLTWIPEAQEGYHRRTWASSQYGSQYGSGDGNGTRVPTSMRHEDGYSTAFV